jgi:hypothetical protein
MANVLTVRDLNAVRQEQREKTIRYSVALSGNYTQFVRGQNVGEVLDLTKVQSTQYLPDQYWGSAGPRIMYLLNNGSSGTATSMSIIPGADNLHWLLVIYTAVGNQLATGAYAANAAGLLTDLDIVAEATGRVMD